MYASPVANLPCVYVAVAVYTQCLYTSVVLYYRTCFLSFSIFIFFFCSDLSLFFSFGRGWGGAVPGASYWPAGRTVSSAYCWTGMVRFTIGAVGCPIGPGGTTPMQI